MACLSEIDVDLLEEFDFDGPGPAPAPAPAPAPSPSHDIDAKCGNLTITTGQGASKFFSSFAKYLGNFFQCMILAIRGWTKDKFSLAGLKKNRRWLYILVLLLFIIFLFTLIIALAIPSKAKINKRKLIALQDRHRQEEEAEAMGANAKEESSSHPQGYATGPEMQPQEVFPQVPVIGEGLPQDNPLSKDFSGIERIPSSYY